MRSVGAAHPPGAGNGAAEVHGRGLLARELEHQYTGVSHATKTVEHLTPVDVAFPWNEVIVVGATVVVQVHVYESIASEMDEGADGAAKVRVPHVETHANARRQAFQQPCHLVGMAADQMRQRRFDRKSDAELFAAAIDMEQRLKRIAKPRACTDGIARKIRGMHNNDGARMTAQTACRRERGEYAGVPIAPLIRREVAGRAERRVHGADVEWKSRSAFRKPPGLHGVRNVEMARRRADFDPLRAGLDESS
jgi:hypothetical protein